MAVEVRTGVRVGMQVGQQRGAPLGGRMMRLPAGMGITAIPPIRGKLRRGTKIRVVLQMGMMNAMRDVARTGMGMVLRLLSGWEGVVG